MKIQNNSRDIEFLNFFGQCFLQETCCTVKRVFGSTFGLPAAEIQRVSLLKPQSLATVFTFFIETENLKQENMYISREGCCREGFGVPSMTYKQHLHGSCFLFPQKNSGLFIAVDIGFAGKISG